MHVAQLSGRRTPRDPLALGGADGEEVVLVVDSEWTDVVVKVVDES
jgi:hypothetical protein